MCLQSSPTCDLCAELCNPGVSYMFNDCSRTLLFLELEQIPVKTLSQMLPFYQGIVDYCAQHIGNLFLVGNVIQKGSKAEIQGMRLYVSTWKTLVIFP